MLASPALFLTASRPSRYYVGGNEAQLLRGHVKTGDEAHSPIIAAQREEPELNACECEALSLVGAVGPEVSLMVKQLTFRSARL